MFTLHAYGDWPPGAVHVTWTANEHRVPPDVQPLIEDAWRRAAAPGVQLFDGPMCRLESWSADHDAFNMTLARTSYKQFVGTNLSNPRLPDDVRANPVGVSVALATADGHLLLGRRNANVAYYPNRVHPFAGAMEPREGADPFATVARELREELALPPEATRDVRLIGLVADDAIRQPELIFAASTNCTRDAVDRALDPTEHESLFPIAATPEAIRSASRDAVLTPVAVAAVLLYGRRAFGDAWFAAAGTR